MENAKLLEIGALQVYQLPAPEAQSPKGRCDLRFEIGDWGQFQRKGLDAPSFDWEVARSLHFVEFCKVP